MKLLETIANFNAEAARLRQSTTIDPGVGGIRESLVADRGQGYQRIGRRASGPYLEALAAASELIEGVRKGNIRPWMLEEAMSSSDFPILLGDLMYRQLLGNYSVLEPTYPAISQRTVLKDFRNLNLEMIDGGRQIPEAVKEYAPYPELAFTESKLQIAVGKFGRRFGLSFEMLVNDNLNAFQSRPGQLAIGCRMLEEKTVTSKWIDANGPDATYFTAAHGNKLASNAPFSAEAFQAMLTLISKQRDTDGNPINILGYALVFPPALRIPVQRLMHATELRIGDVTDPTKSVVVTSNWFAGMVKPVENPWIPILATGANGDTTWGVFAQAPGSGRSALYHGFLQGRETPGMYMREPNQINLAGGDTDPMEGDFDHDAIDYKTRHFFGAITGDTKLAYASNGSGTPD